MTKNKTLLASLLDLAHGDPDLWLATADICVEKILPKLTNQSSPTDRKAHAWLPALIILAFKRGMGPRQTITASPNRDLCSDITKLHAASTALTADMQKRTVLGFAELDARYTAGPNMSHVWRDIMTTPAPLRNDALSILYSILAEADQTSAARVA